MIGFRVDSDGDRFWDKRRSGRLDRNCDKSFDLSGVRDESWSVPLLVGFRIGIDVWGIVIRVDVKTRERNPE